MSRTEKETLEPESYRLRDRVSVVNGVLLSTRPLMASQLNDAATDLLNKFDGERYRSPESVAAGTDHDRADVAGLFETLHQRGFLEWRPARDPAYTPSVSVVVTVRDDRTSLEGCLDALAALEYPTYDVIVVDDGSSDGTAAMARQHPLADRDMLQVLSVGDEWDPLGIGASRNRGVASATYDVIAFTDADCRPSPTWLSELVPLLAESDLVGGRIRPVGGTARSSYEGIASSLDMGSRPSRVDPTGDTPYLATANLVGHRTVFEAVPFPDRDVAEDVDVCWRAFDEGFDIVYTPGGLVEHAYDGGHVDMMERRIAYGASEALLARTYGRDGHRAVSLPTDLLLVSLSAPIAIFSTGVLAGLGTLLLIVGCLGIALRMGEAFRRYRVVRELVSPTTVFRSWGRTGLSIGYGIGREVTRYYLLPLGLLAATAAVVWPGTGTAGLWAVLFGVFGVPIAVEYSLQKPDTSILTYASYYTVDQLSYQYGAYLGGIRYRTVVHLDPRSRFRLTGPFGTTTPAEKEGTDQTVASRSSV